MRLPNTVWITLASVLFIITFPACPYMPSSPPSRELPSGGEHQEIGCPIQIKIDDKDLKGDMKPSAGIYYQPLDGTGSRSTPRVIAEEYSYRINIIARARPRAGRIFQPPAGNHHLTTPGIGQIGLKGPMAQSVRRPSLEP
jgi:hypothetical protein